MENTNSTKTKVIVVEGADSFNGLEVYIAEGWLSGATPKLVAQYPYKLNDTDQEVLERIAVDYEIVEYHDGIGGIYTDF